MKRRVMNDLLHRAEVFARHRHEGQTRKGAALEPYTVHLEEVVFLVHSWGGTDWEIAAAWLHDTVEDCPPTSIADIADAFGHDIASIVAELTDDKRLPKVDRKRLQIEKAPKKSPSASIVKIADKCSNVGAIMTSPPAGWSLERRFEYLHWARAVVAGLPHKPAAAITEFDLRCTSLEAALAEHGIGNSAWRS